MIMIMIMIIFTKKEVIKMSLRKIKKKVEPEIFLTRFIAAPKTLLLLLIITNSSAYPYEREGGLRVGGYGSTRFEILKQENYSHYTFTLRRIVPTLSATVKDRLRFYLELEFERFGLLELAEDFKPYQQGLLAKSELEGTTGSEIKLEQMWGSFEIARWINLRIGAILPPVGRFNVLHDDDLWEPARRPLSVRDATTLPQKTAWTELGAGFTGNLELGNILTGYEAYIVNGVTLEPDFEFYVIGGHVEKTEEYGNVKHNHAQLEAVVRPRFGNFRLDTKKEKAVTGRIFLSPLLGYEIGFSVYYGRYTPNFMPPAFIGSGAVDFKVEPLHFLDFEGEYAFTSFGKLNEIVSGFAELAHFKEGEVLFVSSTTGVLVERPAELVSEITLKKKDFADAKHGGWILFRLKFFPNFLRGTFLDLGEESKFVFFWRPEFVQYKNVLLSIDFEDGEIKELKKDDISQMRSTIGIAYRPTQSFVFSLSYELTNLLRGTEFIHSSGKNTQHAILFGFAFGL